MKAPRLRLLAGNLSLVLTLLWLGGCASDSSSHDSSAAMDPAAMELLKAASDKLGAASTVQLQAEHKLDPALGLGIAADRGPIEIMVKRPNQFYAIQQAGNETREIAYDGKTLFVMHPAAKHHASGTVEADSIEQFAQLVDERFGFRPPVAELLANDMASELLIDVTSVRSLGKQREGGVHCDHLQLIQPGMSTDLWVGAEDKLPRRLLITVTQLARNPTWDVRFSKWKLDAPLDESLFAKRPAAGSQQVQMLKSR